MMLVVIRADASAHVGSGHVIRCLTLADRLKEAGADVHFISRNDVGNCNATILARGHRLHELRAGLPDFSKGDRSTAQNSAEAMWEDDAAQTASILSAEVVKPDWLVVDHYALDGRWARLLRNAVDKIAVIDDLADRDLECDLLLDQNLHRDFAVRYNGRVPSSALLLLGPQYALLAPAYAQARPQMKPRRGTISRLFVYFGAADQANLTGRVLQAFLDLDRFDVNVDVVVASSHPCRQAIFRIAKGQKNIVLHGDLPTLTPLLSAADIAVGAGGTTSWERICLGLPAIVVTLAENQLSVAEALHDRGLIDWIGHVDTIRQDDLRNSLKMLLSQDIEVSFPRFCSSFVDGLGASRVTAAFLAGPRMPLVAHQAEASDESLLLDWANDPETRRNAFSQARITPDEHHDWFRARLETPAESRILIISTAQHVAVGQVRFDRVEPSAWIISYSIAAEFRGKGLARRALRAAMDQLDLAGGPVRLFARVRRDNVASQKVFRGMAFDLVRETDGWLEYCFTV